MLTKREYLKVPVPSYFDKDFNILPKTQKEINRR